MVVADKVAAGRLWEGVIFLILYVVCVWFISGGGG